MKIKIFGTRLWCKSSNSRFYSSVNSVQNMANKQLCNLIVAAYLEKHAAESIATGFKKHANIKEENLEKYDKFLDILECTNQLVQFVTPIKEKSESSSDDSSEDVGEKKPISNGVSKSTSIGDTNGEIGGKKRKLSEVSKSPAVEPKRKKENGTTPKNSPFRRVESEKVEISNAALRDNSYKSFDTYGAKANKDLIVTQGKSFRHEKTKKKRGSYRGGSINTGVNSIKFDSD